MHRVSTLFCFAAVIIGTTLLLSTTTEVDALKCYQCSGSVPCTATSDSVCAAGTTSCGTSDLTLNNVRLFSRTCGMPPGANQNMANNQCYLNQDTPLGLGWVCQCTTDDCNNGNNNAALPSGASASILFVVSTVLTLLAAGKLF